MISYQILYQILQTTPLDLTKLSNIVKNYVGKKDCIQ